VCLRWRDFCRGGRPWLFQTSGYCYWWEIVPSGNVSFAKRILVGWLSGGWTQKCLDRFGWWPLRLRGEITSAEGLHDWGRRAVLLLNYTLAFSLQLRKSTENLSQGSRVVGDCSLRCPSRPFRDSLGWPAEHQTTLVTRGWLQSALGRHRCFPSCQTKGFPASANFESKLSVSALMWSAKNGIPKSSWICLLLMYQGG
jgi:hypothetical protein